MPEDVGFDQRGDLVAELELVQDLLHVGREAIQVGFEVGLELLLPGAGAQVAQGERGGIVEGLTGSLAQGGVLVGDPGLVEAASSCSSTACLVGSSTASSRRMTVMGRITSRYLPRT